MVGGWLCRRTPRKRLTSWMRSVMIGVMDASTTLPKTGITLAEARTTLSGLHFATEALSEGEREILYIAEGLLRLIDAAPGTAEITELAALVTTPGVTGIDVYPDGVEVTGAPDDVDASAGFVEGRFGLEDVRSAVGPHLPITDCR